MSNGAITFAKEHPAGTAIGAVVVVLVVMYMFSGSSGSSANSLNSAYYNALAQQTQAGHDVQMATIAANAQHDQTVTAGEYGIAALQIKAAEDRYAIDSNERINDVNTAAQSHAIDNAISLQNATLHSNEIINGQNTHAATKQHNSFWGNLGGIFSGIGSVASSLFPAGI